MSDVTPPEDTPTDEPAKLSTKAKTAGPKATKVKSATPKAKVPATKASSKAPAEKPKTVKEPKELKEPKEKKEKRVSAAQRFKDLIMQGKATDDEIFDIVKAEFGLPDTKRNYVQWYRSWCKTQGMNPPERMVRDESGKLVPAASKRLPVTKAALTAAQKNAAKVAAAKAANRKAKAAATKKKA